MKKDYIITYAIIIVCLGVACLCGYCIYKIPINGSPSMIMVVIMVIGIVSSLYLVKEGIYTIRVWSRSEVS